MLNQVQHDDWRMKFSENITNGFDLWNWKYKTLN